MAIRVNGLVLETDEEGFLLDPEAWDEQVAEAIAEDLGIDMQAAHWQVVRFVREYFEERQAVPEARRVLKALGEALGKEHATRRYLYSLFPYGYGQQACKIAGMRKPKKLMLDI